MENEDFYASNISLVPPAQKKTENPVTSTYLQNSRHTNESIWRAPSAAASHECKETCLTTSLLHTESIHI